MAASGGYSVFLEFLQLAGEFVEDRSDQFSRGLRVEFDRIPR